jgi:hypothetical protein
MIITLFQLMQKFSSKPCLLFILQTSVGFSPGVPLEQLHSLGQLDDDHDVVGQFGEAATRVLGNRR